jgi:hypothetical protein
MSTISGAFVSAISIGDQLAAESHAVGTLADSDIDGFSVPSWSALSICALGRQSAPHPSTPCRWRSLT